MSIKSAFSNISYFALGVVVLIACIAVPVLIIMGGIAVGMKLLPWLFLLSFFTFCFDVIILAPFTLFRATRFWAALGFIISSFIFGLTGWFLGLLLTWSLWGGFAVLIGLCFLGVGVVPMAMLATLFNGMWTDLGMLIFVVVSTFGLRTLGAYLMVKVSPKQEQIDNSQVIDV